jgi:hypothetical protein
VKEYRLAGLSRTLGCTVYRGSHRDILGNEAIQDICKSVIGEVLRLLFSGKRTVQMIGEDVGLQGE